MQTATGVVRDLLRLARKATCIMRLGSLELMAATSARSGLDSPGQRRVASSKVFHGVANLNQS